MSKRAILTAVGDVGVCRADPASMFTHVKPVLARGDLVFGQLETTITARGGRAPHAKLAMRAPPDTARMIADAGFDVMSFAGNHCMDWGEEGFADTMAHMAAANVQLCGAGQTIAQARAPVIASCGDASIAFLAYSSILPEGYWADARRPGCAPLRAHTTYEMIEPDQPGTPPRILTHPHADDFAALLADVKNAKAHADIVAVSMHWGIHMTPVVLADYQRTVAHAAIDAGADMILGHHPHILKGVEFYLGAPIFYSMGNFAIEQPQAFDAAITETASFKHLLSLNPSAQPEGLYLLPPDTRMSVIVEAAIEEKRIASVAVTPVWIDDSSTPQPLSADDSRFAQVAAYLERISREAGLATRFAAQGDQLHLSA
jgi:poly-gamma-glutamate synthesis protein (capsule biosynthesis protein)